MNRADDRDSTSYDATAIGANIPNLLHFVYVLDDPQVDFAFQFKHFLSVYAAWHYWRPEKIFIHTNAHEDYILRAQNGTSGKWNGLIFGMPGVVVNQVTAPTHANNGEEIKYLEHRSDFVRVQAVHDHGGIYIDFDVYPLRDIRVLRESGFRAVAGRQLEGQINSGTFMSVKRGKMMRLWMEGMHDRYTGGWTTHSNEVITRASERVVREPGEMLIMEREAFAPGSWTAADVEMLWATHPEEPSNLANVTQGDELPAHGEVPFDEWSRSDGRPGWARDWSCTYMLHAFSARFVRGAKYEDITPRYVLDRRSNFARAVYPVAKEMYDRGLIELDDSHLGA